MFHLIIISFFLLSCGKSPLLKELSKEATQITSMEVSKTFQVTSQKVQINWMTPINSIEEGRAIILLTKEGTVFEDQEYELNAYLWMKSMGHGSSPIVITKLAKGIYQLSEIYFTMTGDWQLHLTLNKNNKVIEDLEFEYFLTL